MNQYFSTQQLSDLEPIAEQLIPLIKKRKKVAFLGEIGAGKTTLIKIICKKLGVKEVTASPTFSIINEYHSPTLPIYHIDLYRLKEEQEAFSIGLIELLEQENYCMIEWPGIIENYLPIDTLWIQIVSLEKEKRKISVFFE